MEVFESHFERNLLQENSFSLDLIPAHPLHSPRASEESPLLYRTTDDPAGHPLRLWHVSSALHEDGFPPPDDPAGPCQVRELREPK